MPPDAPQRRFLHSVRDLSRPAATELLDQAEALAASSAPPQWDRRIAFAGIASDPQRDHAAQRATMRLGCAASRWPEALQSRDAPAGWGDPERFARSGAALLVLRLADAGAAQKVRSPCPLLNAGDGAREDVVEALIAALTLRRAFGLSGALDGLSVALFGPVLESGAARSIIALFGLLNARLTLCGPTALLPADADRWGVSATQDRAEALAGADAVIVLPLDPESRAIASLRDYEAFFGLDHAMLVAARRPRKIAFAGPSLIPAQISAPLWADPALSLWTQRAEAAEAMHMALFDLLFVRVGP
jgi:aspartate carbamoyltransferase catalytic subunit